jgi:phosphoglycerate kinase
MMQSLQQAALEGQRALIRVDFNVPMDEGGTITDDSRIREAVPTIQHVLNSGGAAVLISHLGRPKGERKAELSLDKVRPHLEQLLGQPVRFLDDPLADGAIDQVQALAPGEVLLCENLRFYPGEKQGDPVFAQQLARLGDVYINDAFGTAHRSDASVSAVPACFQEKYCGLLMEREILNAERVVSDIKRPYVIVIGGAKVSDKIGLLRELMPKADTVIIGGGMSYTFLKALGQAIGASICEDDKLELARELLQAAERNGTKVLLPEDALIGNKLAADAETQISPAGAIPDGWMGLDLGPKAIEQARQALLPAKTILWNGPMGVFEYEPFAQGTVAIAEAVAEATTNTAYSLVGGGDSAAAVRKAGLDERISYVSTGGGALLEYVEGKMLPGVQALQSHASNGVLHKGA